MAETKKLIKIAQNVACVTSRLIFCSYGLSSIVLGGCFLIPFLIKPFLNSYATKYICLVVCGVLSVVLSVIVHLFVQKGRKRLAVRVVFRRGRNNGKKHPNTYSRDWPFPRSNQIIWFNEKYKYLFLLLVLTVVLMPFTGSLFGIEGLSLLGLIGRLLGYILVCFPLLHTSLQLRLWEPSLFAFGFIVSTELTWPEFTEWNIFVLGSIFFIMGLSMHYRWWSRISLKNTTRETDFSDPKTIIASALNQCTKADVNFLLSVTGLSQESFLTHVADLLKLGYVEQRPVDDNARLPHTTYALTPIGRKTFKKWTKDSIAFLQSDSVQF